MKRKIKRFDLEWYVLVNYAVQDVVRISQPWSYAHDWIIPYRGIVVFHSLHEVVVRMLQHWLYNIDRNILSYALVTPNSLLLPLLLLIPYICRSVVNYPHHMLGSEDEKESTGGFRVQGYLPQTFALVTSHQVDCRPFHVHDISTSSCLPPKCLESLLWLVRHFTKNRNKGILQLKKLWVIQGLEFESIHLIVLIQVEVSDNIVSSKSI